jgi:hypothetical protein
MNAVRPGAARPDLKSLLPASPDAYPQALDLVRGLVLVIRMDARAYRTASFLDDRILGATTEGAWLATAAAAQAAAALTGGRPLHFIFHTGHVGSTLLSRLLDETGAVLGLREPLPLRTLADAEDTLGDPASLLGAAQFDSLVETFLRFWSRGYAATRAVVVKATSSAGRLAPRLLAASPASRAVYLNVGAETYLATLLGGANSVADLRGHGPGRMRRLLAGRSLPVAPLHALCPGELAALGWLVESLAQAATLSAAGGRTLMLDFDALLTDLPAAAARVFAHFGLPQDDAFLRALAGSAVLTRYSKAPEQPFTPGERALRLGQARREQGAEIAKGLAWLERVARADAGLAAVVGSQGLR